MATNTQQPSIQNRLAEIAKKDAIAKIDFAFESLVTKAQPTAVIPEDVFVYHFLPYFSGEKPMTPETRVMENWVGISGTPTNEVTVVDKAGKPLYKVPPVYDTHVLDVTKRNIGQSMSDIYSGFAMRNNNLPVAANNFLMNELGKRMDGLVGDKEIKLTETQQRWQEIMARYGKSPVVPQPASTVQSTTPAATDKADDLVYD